MARVIFSLSWHSLLHMYTHTLRNWLGITGHTHTTELICKKLFKRFERITLLPMFQTMESVWKFMFHPWEWPIRQNRSLSERNRENSIVKRLTVKWQNTINNGSGWQLFIYNHKMSFLGGKTPCDAHSCDAHGFKIWRFKNANRLEVYVFLFGLNGLIRWIFN